MKLIEILAADKKIKEACKKIGYPNHEDLYQELFIVLCELPENKLEELHNSGRLQFWIVRTLLNMVSKNGTFFIKYNVIYDDSEAAGKLSEQGEEREQILELEKKRAEAESLLKKYENSGQKNGGWYKVNLLRMYCEVGSVRKLGELTGIRFTTINRDIIDFIKELRTNLNHTSS